MMMTLRLNPSAICIAVLQISILILPVWTFQPIARTAAPSLLGNTAPFQRCEAYTSRLRAQRDDTDSKKPAQQAAGKPRFAQQSPNQKRRRPRPRPQTSDGPTYRADGALIEQNLQRVKTAGRIGTKRYVDPNKVFIGNLPYSIDDDALFAFVLDTMGQSRLVLQSAKVIREWKTGKSKGYGFCMFTDPMYATVCMDIMNGQMLEGRRLTASQGKKKDADNELYIKKQKEKKQAKKLSEEEMAIASGLQAAEEDAEFFEDDEDVPIFGGENEEDFELDARLFGIAAADEEDDEDDDDIDGIFVERHFKYEEVDEDLNREQRRDAQRRMKRKKKPSRGFGAD